MTLQYDEDESEGDMIEKLNFSIEKNNLKLQGSFIEKAARLKLWNFDTDDGKPLVFEEFHISRPVLHFKYLYTDDTIDKIRERKSSMNER